MPQGNPDTLDQYYFIRKLEGRTNYLQMHLIHLLLAISLPGVDQE